MASTLDTDYLVIGAGAVSMAFVDEILHADRSARVVMVDRRATPGGHWNDAYPFVGLHQPALYYGVSSEPLGDGGEDLVSKGQILGYYDRVLRKLSKTGRLTFLPQCDYEGEGRVRSRVVPEQVWEVKACWLVDGTYTGITVPSTTPPRYSVEPGVALVPINGIASLSRPWRRYVVIGAGKTGMDAVLYLLGQGVPPKSISWVISRDAWLIDRHHTQPKHFLSSTLKQIKCHLGADSMETLFASLEEIGFFIRLDPDKTPEAFRCATVSREELAQLRQVEDCIRMGRVQRITSEAMVLDDGEVAVEAETLFVDCTADGLTRKPVVPIFQEDRVVLQPVAFCQPTFSGAVVARMMRQFDNNADRNHHCQPVPHPAVPGDLLRSTLAAMTNLDRWGRVGSMLPWLLRCRLNVGAHAGVFRNLWFLAKALPHIRPTMENLTRLCAKRD